MIGWEDITWGIFSLYFKMSFWYKTLPHFINFRVWEAEFNRMPLLSVIRKLNYSQDVISFLRSRNISFNCIFNFLSFSQISDQSQPDKLWWSKFFSSWQKRSKVCSCSWKQNNKLVVFPFERSMKLPSSWWYRETCSDEGKMTKQNQT